MKRKRATILSLVAAFLVTIVAWSWLRIGTDGFSSRAQPSRIEQIVAATARKMAMPADAKRLRNPVPFSADTLEQARAHWADHCAFCHGNDGSGNTEVGRNLYPKPPDMRGSPTQSLSDGELYFAINRGIRLSGMPAWGEGLDRPEPSGSGKRMHCNSR